MNSRENVSVKIDDVHRATRPTRTHRLIRRGVVGSVIAVTLIGVAIVVCLSLMSGGQKINADGYQAVYLANGQMYFGKLQNTEGTYLYMKAPYMPQATGGQTSDNSASALIRVKNQLWGPEDSIAIRVDQIAFWQNLRDDSKVVQAIKSKE